MLKQFDLVASGITFKVRSFEHEAVPVIVYRIEAYLAHPDNTARPIDNIGGDVVIDMAFALLGMAPYEMILRKIEQALEIIKKEKPDLVGMV